MATFKSTQITNIETVPIVKMSSDQYQGQVCMSAWDYTPPGSAEPAAGDNVRLNRIPDGSRVMQTYFGWAIQDSGATGAIGITGTTSKYMAAQTMTAAGVKFAPTLIGESNLLTVGNVNNSSEEEQIMTLATAGLAATTGLISGWFLYMY